MMTPQMLITIPHAAIFGPQNRSDGMSAFIDQPEAAFISDSLRKRRNDPSTEPRSQLILLITRRYSAELGSYRDHAQRPMKTPTAPRPASSSVTDQWRSTSKVAQHSLYPVYLLLFDFYKFFLLNM